VKNMSLCCIWHSTVTKKAYAKLEGLFGRTFLQKHIRIMEQ